MLANDDLYLPACLIINVERDLTLWPHENWFSENIVDPWLIE